MVLVLLKDFLDRFEDQLSVSDLLNSRRFSLTIDLTLWKVLDDSSYWVIVSSKSFSYLFRFYTSVTVDFTDFKLSWSKLDNTSFWLFFDDQFHFFEVDFLGLTWDFRVNYLEFLNENWENVLRNYQSFHEVCKCFTLVSELRKACLEVLINPWRVLQSFPLSFHIFNFWLWVRGFPPLDFGVTSGIGKEFLTTQSKFPLSPKEISLGKLLSEILSEKFSDNFGLGSYGSFLGKHKVLRKV